MKRGFLRAPTQRRVSRGVQLTMASTSKQECRVKQPPRNWSELPTDIMLNILQRISVTDKLENVQKVCTAWRKFCKDPAVWRVIYLKNASDKRESVFQKMCKHAVDRSQGQLVDITMIGFCDKELLLYVADRSSQLRRLVLKSVWHDMNGAWSESTKKLPLLEELSVELIYPDDIEAIGRNCPLLKTLKVNLEVPEPMWASTCEEAMILQNGKALAIAKFLPQLTHLELNRNCISNFGLAAILDGCSHLESLDVRRCRYLNLDGALGKRCSQQIKNLKLPHDFLKAKGYEQFFQTCDHLAESDDEDHDSFDNKDEYYGYSDHDDDDDDADDDDDDDGDDGKALADLWLLRETLNFINMS